MKFGPVPIGQACGAILAHAVSVGGVRLKKGHRLTDADIAALAESGSTEVIVASLEPGDVGEDEAAVALAGAFRGTGIHAAPPATGRVNLHADHAGLFRADRALVDALNAIDPAVTFACLNDRASVAAGDMVATIKIIPLAVSGASLSRAEAAIAAASLARVLPYRSVRAGLVATELPTLKPSVMDKTRELIAARLAVSGSELVEEARVAHRTDAVAAEIRRMAGEFGLVLVFGASAVTDSADVIPQAIRDAGGVVERVGMPVDPGNLLVLGSVDSVPVIGAPGCARSPKENGFDWVLARVLAGETPSSDEIAGMGVGGLLMEIPSRPQPRQGKRTAKGGGDVGIVLLAAGRASRMGEGAGHKLLAKFDGEPLIRRMARTALGSKATQVVAVTGHRGEAIESVLEGLNLEIVANPRYASGMASSLRAGVNALSAGAGGALVLLGDMPALTASHLDMLIDAFANSGGDSIVRACDGERRGNPVILPRKAFSALQALDGDVGARAIIDGGGFPVLDVEIGPAARLDVDTPEAVRRAGGVVEILSNDDLD